ncbi:MAG: phosphoglucosamine mutase [Armatimonadota bacterium]
MSVVRTLKTGISGVRGVVGDSLTPQLLIGFAQAFGTYVEGGLVMIGRDTRPSGEMVLKALTGGLLATGCEIIDLGVCPVPTAQMAIRDSMADGGIVISASHNPQEWNALKFIRHDGICLYPHQIEELLSVYYQGNFSLVGNDDIRGVRYDDRAIDRHISAVMDVADVDAIRDAGLRVVVDCCNGAGSVMTEAFLEGLGCETIAINNAPTGIFPHPPEPDPENLLQLEDAVQEHGADIGFAQDADADRLAIVSEKGSAIGEEYTLTFACDAIGASITGPIVTNLSTSRMIDDVAARYGLQVYRTPVGEINVIQGMQARDAEIGGEGNGGVILPRVQYCRDNFTAMTLILGGLARRRGTVTDWAETFSPSAIAKERVECPSSRVQPALLGLREEYADLQLDLTEGVRVTWDDDSWLHVRASNTEPILRVIAEASTPQAAKQKTAHARQTLRKHI